MEEKLRKFVTLKLKEFKIDERWSTGTYVNAISMILSRMTISELLELFKQEDF